MENKDSVKTNLTTILLILALIIIFIIIGRCVYKLYKYKNAADIKLSGLNNEVASLQNKKEVNDDIIKYELKTHEYFSNRQNIKNYYINSESELNEFYNIYSDKLNIDKEYLNNNSIFIQVDQVSSGSIQKKLSSVTFDNNTVNFIVDTDSPEIGTMDMAFWYLVAIIPNEQLNNLNLSNWVKPSKIK